MTTATLTDAATVTLAFPLAAAEGLRHAITLAIHERPTSERDMLASIYGALVNPQPASVRAARAPVDVLANAANWRIEMRGDERCIVEPDVGVVAVVFGDGPEEAKTILYAVQQRAAIAELIYVAEDARDSLSAANKIYSDGAIGILIDRLSAALARVGSAGGAP